MRHPALPVQHFFSPNSTQVFNIQVSADKKYLSFFQHTEKCGTYMRRQKPNSYTWGRSIFTVKLIGLINIIDKINSA